jgi:threonine dehydratase
LNVLDVEAAAGRIAGKIVRTPMVRNDAISRLTGADVWLKLDTLQVTGAFKERGASNRIALLTEAEAAKGVIAMSAGNHAQAVARHASLSGISATIVMPAFTPSTKVTRTRRWGATVILFGNTLAEAAEHARFLAEEQSLTFVHPYDDDAVIAGQGTVALEMFEDVPGIDTMVIPVGGGGLIAGCALAVKQGAKKIDVFGVEVESYSAMAQALAGLPIEVGGSTIAEGIAVRDIGQRSLDILRDLEIKVLTVPEKRIEDAIALLAEEAKIVSEGAGAAGIAAILAYPDRFRGRNIGVPVCGANIDNRALASVLQRVMLRDGRLVRLVLDIPDRPGVLGEISSRIGAAGANILEVSHHRLFSSPSVQAARLEIMFEARDSQHGDDVVSVLAENYSITRL